MLIRRKHPDAVIVDDLPDTDAATFCRELRDHCWVTPSTPDGVCEDCYEKYLRPQVEEA